MCVARRGARAASSVFYCPPHALPPLLPNPRRSGSFQLSVDYFKTGAVHENWFRLHGAGGEDCGEIHLRGQQGLRATAARTLWFQLGCWPALGASGVRMVSTAELSTTKGDREPMESTCLRSRASMNRTWSSSTSAGLSGILGARGVQQR